MMRLHYNQKSILVAVQSVKGHICFKNHFLLKLLKLVLKFQAGGS